MIEVYGVDIPGGEPVSAFPDSLTVAELAVRLGVSSVFLVSLCALHSLAVTADTVVVQPQAERIAKIVEQS